MNEVNPRLQELDRKRRAHMAESLAARAPFARVALWMMYLPISRRQQILLGRIYSFQATDGEYRLSLANGARELNMFDRTDLQHDLAELMGNGFVTKISNGTRKPASYLVDVAKCIEVARENGWK